MRNHFSIAVVACGLACAAGFAQANTSSTSSLPLSQSVLTSAVNSYLQDHGDLCVAKFTWPRDVTAADQSAQTNDAVQLPVLEHLGLVHSQVLPAHGATGAGAGAPAVTRYSLTAKGREFYLQKRRAVVGPHDQPVEHDADFCVARLRLDKVIKWTSPAPANGHLESVVWYTYRVTSADWMTDPQARRVFPVVDRIIRGQGHLLMTATVQAQQGGWVPVLPGQ